MLVGLLLSVNLWLPFSRTFPHAPLIQLNDPSRTWIEVLLTCVLLASVTISLLVRRPRKFLVVVLISLVILIILDQMRLQPWVFHYLTLLIVILLSNEESSDHLTISLLQLLVAALYFWSGLQKLNYSFHQEVLPQLLDGIRGFSAIGQKQLLVLGIVIASVEILTGIGLLIKRLRRLSLWTAIAMHIVILSLLVALRVNTVVWPWNITMIAVLLILFREHELSLRQTLTNQGSRLRIAQVVTLLVIILPLLSFWGWWDLYLSGALYSGSTPVAVVRVNQVTLDSLGEQAKRQVFVTNNNEQMLPLYEWSMSELNVPPYSDERVFKRIAHEICQRANPVGIELIMKGEPERFTGRYNVKRLTCSELY